MLNVGLGMLLWVWDLLLVGLGFARRRFAAMGLGFGHCGLVFFFFLVVGFAHGHAL